MTNASRLKFDIPVKTESLRLISILLYSTKNTLQVEILYFIHPVLHARRLFKTQIRIARGHYGKSVKAAQEPIGMNEVSLPYNNVHIILQKDCTTIP